MRVSALVAVLLGVGLLLGSGLLVPRRSADSPTTWSTKYYKENPANYAALPEPGDAQKQLPLLIRDLQFALEGGSSRSFLNLIDAERFNDYPRFESMIERLLRENTIRMHTGMSFMTPPATPSASIAQMVVDVEMELGRKDDESSLVRRSQQLTINFDYTKKGWKIVSLGPWGLFAPLSDGRYTK